EGRINSKTATRFNSPVTNIHALLSHIQNDYEGRNLKGVVLMTDGIYNTGISPGYTKHNFPIYTLGLGDTIPKKDISIQQIRYNKISYQGNQFPIEVEVLNEGYHGNTIVVSLLKGNKVLGRESFIPGKNRELNLVRFMADAEKSGLQQFSIKVDIQPDEFTTSNNQEQIFIQIVDGKENILMISRQPHPDIKAFRAAIETNSNYSFFTRVPGIIETREIPKKIDLIIYYDLTGQESFLNTILSAEERKNIPSVTIYGNSLLPQQVEAAFDFISLRMLPRETDQVTGAFNPAFSSFKLSPELQSFLKEIPPLSVPFGDISVKNSGEILLFQRVGSIETTKALFLTSNTTPRKVLLIGEGLWRWRLHDYMKNGDHHLFNELISKIVQFGTTVEDKSKLRVYPLENETTNESVVLETEVYDDLYERVYGTTLNVTIIDQNNNMTKHSFVPTRGNTNLRINNLKSGIYRYEASTVVDNQTHKASGEFIIKEQQIEFANLTADFNLLRRLASETNGHFYPIEQVEELVKVIEKKEPTGVIHSQETYQPVVNIPWIFFLLLGLVSMEWFVRKYSGSY
ncbi:MAG: VWA domain-containing protein, partial [Cyclobacteriaceae bacterium]|nr:VWA domain-containing protein [Cyclobacteriaceae bacterium]